MDIEKWIVVTPGIRSGKPCIVGTRITVYDILEYLAGGMTEQEILSDFPALRLEHIKATLAFAAQRERRLAA
ncbi:MAG: hypothetical protein A3H35_00355 [Betaproteobacteria bacterium RIFCSPLOWO2_02_FULL_62_17]|nr:MAG: hypothetical protein A3H35_00355 [Betaproteobacteria bacterium RIFCSPLOWO2_02_FULL_62_17]